MNNDFEKDYTNTPSDEYTEGTEKTYDEYKDTAFNSTEAVSENTEYAADTAGTVAGDSSSVEQDSSYHFKGSEIPAQDNTTAYDSNYGTTSTNSYGTANTNSYGAQSPYNNGYGSQGYNTDSQYGYNDYNPYNASTAPNQQGTATASFEQNPIKAKKPKKAKKPVSRGALAVILVVAILFSGVVGFAGSYVASKFTNGNGLVVNQSAGNSGSPSVTEANTSGLTADIVSKTADTVVEITTETVATGSYFQQYISKGAGSGVIISADGYILTNNHVIDGANTVKVTLRDGTSYDAEVIGKDATLDVALLKVDATDLAYATFGDSSSLKVGDYAVVIGNPLGQLGGTVTDGIVSALDRDVIIGNETMSLLQTNAAINPGNSGGGMFNSNGELIGIVCAKASSSDTEVEGLGFAIPINDVLDILDDLKTVGYVQGRVDMGMSLVDASSLSQVYQPGVYVNSVTAGSSADDAGFRKGDLITQVNGEDVDSVAAVNKIIESLNVGDNVKFTVMRGSQTGTLTMKLKEYNPKEDTLDSFHNDQNAGRADDDNSAWNPFNW